jgi:hypothetical protein
MYTVPYGLGAAVRYEEAQLPLLIQNHDLIIALLMSFNGQHTSSK